MPRRRVPQVPKAMEAATPPMESLKVVIQLRPRNAMVGVSQPGKDPHLVSLEMAEVQELEQVLAEVPGIVELARAKWDVSPQYPKYTRPAPPPRPAAPAATARARPTPKPAPKPQPSLF